MNTSISKLVLGTVQFGLNYGINNVEGQISQDEALKILDYCKKSGIRSLDTAAAYGSSEEVLGELLSSSFGRMDFSLTTKFKFCENHDLASLTRESLRKIKRSRIENQLFHSFFDYQKYLEFPKPREIERWGVSLYSNSEISAVIEDPDVRIIQCPFNLLDNDSKRGELLKKAKAKGIEVQVRSVFLQGLFFMDRSNLPNNLSSLKPYLLRIDDICKKNDLTIQELALGYCAAKKYVDKIVIGVDSLKQLKSNIGYLSRNIRKEIFHLVDNISVEREYLLNPSNWKF